MWLTQSEKVRAMSDRSECMNALKECEKWIQEEREYQENIFVKMPRIRGLLEDYERSSA